ncbi:uncharacterized protein ARMOST_22037 [Armillaria ostoyae]|uniref:Uncharacterized protein n=1 Tax=Armillaria ostoyae TaxID=47428 RepID=A0A284SBR0_ARMOS|nr:uncharacterized protein ARMOST_22037 [Armillaria ostoyae]
MHDVHRDCRAVWRIRSGCEDADVATEGEHNNEIKATWMGSYTSHVLNQIQAPAASCQASVYAQQRATLVNLHYPPVLTQRYVLGGLDLSASSSISLLHTRLPKFGTTRLAVAILAGQPLAQSEQAVAPSSGPPDSCHFRGPQFWRSFSIDGIRKLCSAAVGYPAEHIAPFDTFQ